MTLEAIGALVIAALQELESAGAISIGGWNPAQVNQVLGAIGSILQAVPGTGGLGGQSTPPGTDGNPTGNAPSTSSSSTPS